MRGSGLPWRGSGEMPLVESPPISAQVHELLELLAVREAARGGEDRAAQRSEPNSQLSST